MAEHKTTADHWIPTFRAIFYSIQPNTTNQIKPNTYNQILPVNIPVNIHRSTNDPSMELDVDVLLCVLQWSYYNVHGVDWASTTIW